MRTVNISLLLATCVILIACGPSQVERDAQATQIAADIFATQTAEAPTATLTALPPTATPTPVPPTATLTPVPPTATPTPQPLVINGEAFEADIRETCNTDIEITEVTGDGGLGVSGSMSIRQGRWAVWCYGAKHTWIGNLSYGGYVFMSDENNPLQFTVDQDKGYVYLAGIGSVQLPDGSIVQLSDERIAQQTAALVPPTATPTPKPATVTPTVKPPTATPTPTRIATSTPTATPPPMPDAQVQANTLNVRSGPGTDYSIVDTLRLGDSLQVIGRYGSDCSWLEVITPTGLQGWVAGTTQYVTLNRSCADIPLGEVRPPTSLIGRYVSGSGLGEMLIKNGTDGDGVVILTRSDETPVMAAYIRGGGSYRMTGIPNGVYRLYFSKGEKWNDEEKAFTEQVRHQRFEDTFSFSTTATTYSIWEITLYGVVGGTAGSVNVPPAQFPKLP